MTIHDMSPSEERLLELLADRATQGLSKSEEAELAELLANHPEIDVRALEEAAAAVDLCFSKEFAEPLPPHLRRKAQRSAQAYLSTETTPSELPRPSNLLWPTLAISGWLATAAALALVVWQWQSNPVQPTISPREILQAWLREPGCCEITGQPGNPNKYPQAGGKVVWNANRQKGFLILHDVPVNDPGKSRYQLWIIDAARKGPPVDGGLFDVNSKGEVIVPFSSRLPVNEPAAFAVTREQPTGVVVSKQEDVVFLAALAK